MQRMAVFSLALVCSLSGCSVYSPRPRSAGVRVASPPPVTTAAAFSAGDAALVRSHYAAQSRGRGRGRGLPPGIEKNLQRGKPLPPGIARQQLPEQLLVELPPAPRGLEYVIVAGKLLLVEIGTQIVREILIEAVFD